MRMKLVIRCVSMWACLGTLACVGNGNLFGGDANPSGRGLPVDTSPDATNPSINSAIPSDHIPPVNPCTSNRPAPRGYRRLTVTELTNTLADLFHDPSVPVPSGIFSGDPVTYGLHSLQTDLAVRATGALQVMNMAEGVATYASSRLSSLFPCSSNTAACQKQLLTSFGTRAFRQPLTDAQVAAYQSLMASMPDFNSAAQAMISGLLQSPYFLYRSEMGVEVSNGTFPLTQYEIASELSYLITGSMPDDALLQAAANNALGTPAQIAQQAQRLLENPRARATVDEFFAEWVAVSELPLASRMEGTDTLSASTKADMLAETKALVDDVVFNKNGSFSDLLGANYTFATESLGIFYGITGASGTTPVQVPVQSRVPGVLGHGGVLSMASQANYASPTMRGRMVRMRVLCQAIPKPPPGIPPIDTGVAQQTTRQRFEAHETSSGCAACHTMMDPLGFTMGNFDTLGRLRVNGTENGIAVDTSGALTQMLNPADNATVSGMAQMVAHLQNSPQVGACLARHWAMYGYGRLSYAQDGCTYDAIAADAAKNNYNLLQTFLGLTRLQSFTVRAQDP